MSVVAAQLMRTTISTIAEIHSIYADKKTTCKRVLRLIEANPVTPAERQAIGFLLQYIRGLNKVGLRMLLRFVTGSDIVCVTKEKSYLQFYRDCNIDLLHTTVDHYWSYLENGEGIHQ